MFCKVLWVGEEPSGAASIVNEFAYKYKNFSHFLVRPNWLQGYEVLLYFKEGEQANCYIKDGSVLQTAFILAGKWLLDDILSTISEDYEGFHDIQIVEKHKDDKSEEKYEKEYIFVNFYSPKHSLKNFNLASIYRRMGSYSPDGTSVCSYEFSPYIKDILDSTYTNGVELLQWNNTLSVEVVPRWVPEDGKLMNRHKKREPIKTDLFKIQILENNEVHIEEYCPIETELFSYEQTIKEEKTYVDVNEALEDIPQRVIERISVENKLILSKSSTREFMEQLKTFIKKANIY